MIPSLFVWKLRLRTGRWLGFAAVSFALGALSVYLFTSGPSQELRAWRDGLPEVFQALGVMGGGTFGVHVLESAYGFLLPLLVIVHAAFSGEDYYARPLHDGRMAQALAAPHSRLSVLTTLFLAQIVEVILIIAACLAGQTAIGFTMVQGADIGALARVALGFLPVCLPYAAFSSLAAFVGRSPLRAGRLTLLVSLLTLAFTMAARFPALGMLRFFSPLSLHRGLALASGQGGFVEALYALPIAMVPYALSLILFSRRDL